MFIDTATESYRFTCSWCDTTWVADYDLREAVISDGEVLSFYKRAGFACEAPLAAQNICPTCHRGPVSITLLAHRETPGDQTGGAITPTT
jgi:hypothetical protein